MTYFQWTIRLYNKLHVCQELCDMFRRNFFNVIVMDIRHTMANNSVSLEVFIHIYSVTINLFQFKIFYFSFNIYTIIHVSESINLWIAHRNSY